MNQFRINIENEITLYLLKKSAHGRELTKELKIPLTTIQRSLSDLEKENSIEPAFQGRNKIYSIKNKLQAKLRVREAENYKFMKLIQYYPNLRPILEDISKKFPKELIILFGSYAKFTSKSDSDIDIYIDTDNKKLKDPVEMINSKISVKTGKFNKDDLLIKEIIKNHVILQGVDQFYERLGIFS